MEDARDLRQRGIRAAKAGEKDEARQLLQQSIRLDPDNEAAWLWLASVARDSRERIFCLQKLLEINPENETALKALEAANQSAPPPPQPTVKRLPNAPVTATKSATQEIMSQQPGVPVPMPDRIAEAQKQADSLVRSYQTPLPAGVKWVHKTRRRAGEGDIIVYRLYVFAGIMVVLLLLVGGFIFLVQTNDDVREIVLGPSATPTPSPTVTPTFTPGFTPTPSATPRLTLTPSPEPPINLLAASPPALPRATSVYPEILERAVVEAALLIERGEAERAVPTLENERQLTFDTRLEPSPYYYEALGWAQQGRFTEAIQTLDEAVDRLDERPDDATRIRGYLDSAYSQVYWMQVEQGAGAGDALALAQQHAEDAIVGDRRLVAPYLVLSKIHLQANRYGDAIEILEQGRNVPELVSNTVLIMQEAEVYFQQPDYEKALYQAFLTLYIDPSIEAAYEMKIRIAMLRDRPGDAVLAAQDYLYYYPGSTKAFRLLAEARLAENKDDFALDVLSQGLTGNLRDADTQQMLEMRAQIYHRQGHYDLAVADYSRLYEITGEPRIRGLRMQEALAAGEYTQALDDADDLTGSGIVSEGIISFVRGGALVRQSESGSTSNYQRAVQFLNQAVASADVVALDLRGEANELLAQAQLELRNNSAALDAIDAAMEEAETGSRHYWRGRILQARGENAEAISEYEWVLAWSEIFPYPFRVDAEDRLAALRP